MILGAGYHGPHSDSDEEDVSQLEMNESIDVDELVDATHRALIPPMDKDVLFELKSKVCAINLEVFASRYGH